MHLRLPSIDKGVTAFLWAFGLSLYLWLGMLAVGVSKATAFVLAVIAGGAIFIYVRVYGQDEPRSRSVPARSARPVNSDGRAGKPGVS